MQNELKIGQQAVADGSVTTARGDKTGATVTANVHGQFSETAVRGNIMYVSNLVAGVAPGTAFSATPPLTLWNPPSSGKNLAITKISCGYVSGTLGGGCIALGAVPSQVTVPSGGTELTPLCSLIGAPRGVGRGFTGSTVTTTPAILRPMFNMGAFVGTTALAPQDCDILVDGGIVVAPGSAVSLQGIAGAGTTPLVILGFTYEELPV